MSISAKERNILIGGIVAVIIIGLLAFLLGRGCGAEDETTSTVTTSMTVTAPAVTVTTSSEPETEPEPESTSIPLEISDVSWGCEDFSSTPGNEGCIAGTSLDWIAYIAGDVESVTVTISGPEPGRNISLTKGGLHDPGSTALEWYATDTVPMTPGTYYYSYKVVEMDGTTTVVSEDPVMGPFNLPVASP